MQVEQVAATDWETWVRAHDALLLDVREPHEWLLGTLPGARRVRMGDVPGHVESLDPARPILVVCRSGHRSNQVAAYLRLRGFDAAANLAGGMVALGLQS